MINGKFCSCTMPPEMDDDELGLEGEALERALSDLDSEGWKQRSVVGRDSWFRVAILIARIREEILEISLGTDPDMLEERAQ